MGEFIPIARSWDRVEKAREDSDTAYFFELLYLGELATKLITLGLLSSVPSERRQHRYALEYQLVGADSVGSWVKVLHEALRGPAAAVALYESRGVRAQLTQGYADGSDAWQRRCVTELESALGEFEGVEASQGKVSLRRWSDSFATLRNATRGHGAPLAAACSRAAAPLENSLRTLTGNLDLFIRPWVYLHQNFSGKFRVVALGGDVSDFAYLRSSADYNYHDGVYIYWDAPRPVNFLTTDVDISDIYVPNGKCTGQTCEGLSYHSDERVALDVSRWQTPPSARPASETAAPSSLDVVGNVFSTLPPPRPDYVRRPRLEHELWDVLENEHRHPMVTLLGRGGIGKTSLALQVLHDLAVTAETYEFILWFSARDIDLLEQGPRVVRPQVMTISEVADDFVSVIEAMPDGTWESSQDYLRDCLSSTERLGGPALFVLDNFETVQEKAELYNFLDTAIRLPNKVLITTRQSEYKSDYPVDVRGMEETEFRELAHATGVRLGIGHLLTDGYLADVFEESDGHPYVVKVLLGEVANAGNRVDVERIMASKDDLLDALFERTFEALATPVQRVFLTLSNWRSNVPRLALEAALLRPENQERIDVDQALRTLQRASLIEVASSPGDSEDVISVPLAAAVFGRRKLTVHAYKTAIEADTQIIRLFGASKTIDAERGVEPRVERLVSSITQQLDKGGSFEAVEPVLRYVSGKYPPVRLHLAGLYRRRLPGQQGLQRATQEIERYIEDRPEDVRAWRKLADLKEAGSDGLGEVQARLELAQRTDAAITDISAAANRLNQLLAEGQLGVDTDEKRIMAERLRDVFARRRSEADATDLSRLAWLHMHLKDTKGALHYAELGLERDAGNRHCQNLVDRLRS